jgi:hypothetical protein
MTFSQRKINGIEVFTGENEFLSFEIAPAAGGKITSIFNKRLQKEFLWTNKNVRLEIHQAGADYDTNFLGGIDELIPNDIPETIDAIVYPDHGELWTTRLDHELLADRIAVFGKLKLSGLYYKKTVRLDSLGPIVHLDYRIRNESKTTRHFLWKMHAALRIEAGDQLITGAKKARVVDAAYSRFKDMDEFSWPFIEGMDASKVPERNGEMDFFYLYAAEEPEMSLVTGKGRHLFRYNYEKGVFPFQWYFASYGGFLGHYVAVLEPCSSMPMSVTEASREGQCTALSPGEELTTTVSIYAGENI